MFYSNFIFVKKGPLSNIWLAAHMTRKLTKTHVIDTDINISAKSILDPATPLALRLSGQLLLGLVRIYSRKVQYLQEDCSDALTKIKMVFRPGVVDLPPEADIARNTDITLPDNLDQIALDIPELPLDNLEQLLISGYNVDEDVVNERLTESLRVAEVKNITLQDGKLSSIDMEIDLSQQDDLLDLDLTAELGHANEDLIKFDDFGDFGDFNEIMNDSTGAKPLEDSLEVEVGRDAAGEAQIAMENDVSIGDLGKLNESNMADQSQLSLDVSDIGDFPSFDATRMKDDNDNSIDSNNFTPYSEEMSATTAKKNNKRKRGGKREKHDTRIELSTTVIKEGLTNTSDITIVRPTIPLTKRARHSKLRTKDYFAELLTLPSGSSNEMLAPALVSVLQRTLTRKVNVPSDPTVVAEQQKLNQAATRALEETEKELEMARHEEIKDGDLMKDFDFEFDGDFSMQSLDDKNDLSLAGHDFDLDLDMGKDEKQEQEQEQEQEQDKQEEEDNKEEEEEEKEQAESKQGVISDDKFFSEAKDQAEEIRAATGWSKRTKKMQTFLSNHMKKKDSASFEDLVSGRARKTAAGVFYQLLVLKTHKYVDLEQASAYSDITIFKDSNFSRRAHSPPVSTH